jgi:hypothetical protein
MSDVANKVLDTITIGEDFDAASGQAVIASTDQRGSFVPPVLPTIDIEVGHTIDPELCTGVNEKPNAGNRNSRAGHLFPLSC